LNIVLEGLTDLVNPSDTILEVCAINFSNNTQGFKIIPRTGSESIKFRKTNKQFTDSIIGGSATNKSRELFVDEERSNAWRPALQQCP